MSSAPPGPKWRLFAWRAMQFEVPADWELGAADGDDRKGYCRLDDGKMTRLEVRWQKGPARGPVSEVTDRYLKTLSKRGRHEVPAHVRRNASRVRISDAETECFAWHGELDTTGLAVCCRRCGRISLVRVLNRRSESFRPVARRVLESFRDHGRDGLAPWSLLGFRFDVPERYTLTTYQLRAGRLEMDFRAKGVLASAVRVGLADIVLRERSLADWLKNDPVAVFGRGELTLADTAVRGHAGAQIEGMRRRLLRRFFSLVLRSELLRRVVKEPAIRCRAWRCEPSNSIYVARWLGPDKNLPEFETFANSFICHV